MSRIAFELLALHNIFCLPFYSFPFLLLSFIS
nr:MAG TPA: hypothetical protein [Caudoviricetes sp.]